MRGIWLKKRGKKDINSKDGGKHTGMQSKTSGPSSSRASNSIKISCLRDGGVTKDHYQSQYHQVWPPIGASTGTAALVPGIHCSSCNNPNCNHLFSAHGGGILRDSRPPQHYHSQHDLCTSTKQI
ncbi:hypothetical protein RRG08_055679 [Elysia crispata]|uniref:Uncharacterized protein n=1 Tax=Elysia crispata TaxID=231223 RepID=A0AAE0ZBY7_9GAST|nr:hypothetical protein RRG08_055679 [Elysia crispata]